MTLFVSFLWLLLVLVFTRFILSKIEKRRDALKARQLGCLPPPAVTKPFWDPLALGKLRTIMRAAGEQRLPQYFAERERTMSELYDFRAMTMTIPSLGNTTFFTSDPKNIQAVLATQFHDFEIGPVRAGNFGPLLGHGIFTSDGKDWEHSRAMLRPNFARDRISDLDLEQRHCKNLMLALPIGADGWTAKVDLSPLFFRLTLDSSSEFLFGESVNSQLAELPESLGGTTQVRPAHRLFANAFDTAQAHLARRGRLGKRYWLLNPSEFQEACKQCHDFIDYYVQLALRKDSEKSDIETGTSSEKKAYVFLEELAHQTRDPIELRSQLLNILLAGRDTTASLLGWVFYFLACHPVVFEKLRHIILEEFGEYQDQHNITFAGLKSCQYLQHVLSEALRMIPIVPVNGRRSVRDTTLPRGGGPDGMSPVFVKKGKAVGYSVYVMHRNKDLWGQDADEFKPERWIGRKAGWEFLPFNGGPRLCIGQQFALTSAGFAVVRLLQNFDAIENLDATTSVKQEVTLTCKSGSGVQVRLHKSAKSATS